CSIPEFIGRAERIWEASPVLRWHLDGHPHASHVTPEDLEELARSPHLAYLTEFSLRQGWLGTLGLRPLLASPHSSRLNALTLHQCYIAAALVQDLADSPVLDGLQRLDLSGNSLGAEGVRELATRAAFWNIPDLSLAGYTAYVMYAENYSPVPNI